MHVRGSETMKRGMFSLCRSVEGEAGACPTGSILNLAILIEEGGRDIEEGATVCPALRNPQTLGRLRSRINQTEPCPVSRLSGMQKRTISPTCLRRVCYASRYEIAAGAWGAVYHRLLTRREPAGWLESRRRSFAAVQSAIPWTTVLTNEPLHPLHRWTEGASSTLGE